MKLEEFLKERGIAYQVLEHPPAYTAQELAAEEHVSGDMFAKVVVVVNEDGRAALCVLPASRKLDLAKAARVLRTRNLRLADEAEMARLFPDVEVGAEPPFGVLYHLPMVVDERLAEDEDIVFQAGTHRRAVRMKFLDFESVTEARLADVAVRL